MSNSIEMLDTIHVQKTVMYSDGTCMHWLYDIIEKLV